MTKIHQIFRLFTCFTWNTILILKVIQRCRRNITITFGTKKFRLKTITKDNETLNFTCNIFEVLISISILGVSLSSKYRILSQVWNLGNFVQGYVNNYIDHKNQIWWKIITSDKITACFPKFFSQGSDNDSQNVKSNKNTFSPSNPFFKIFKNQHLSTRLKDKVNRAWEYQF